MTVAPFSKIAPAIAAAMVGAYVLDKTIASVFGHEKPSTFSKAHQNAMAKRYVRARHWFADATKVGHSLVCCVLHDWHCMAHSLLLWHV